jgi:23S rRNA (guanosine2251-2'-O)-methyltransferase
MNSTEIELTLWGKHVVREALESKNVRLQEILLADSRDRDLEEITKLAQRAGVRVTRMARDALEKKIGTDKHQQIAGRCLLAVFEDVHHWHSSFSDRKPKMILALDEIQDPQNLGGLLRSAHFFGADGVLLTKDRSTAVTGTVAKASSGALFSVPIIRATNLARELDVLGELGFWRIGLDAAADKSLAEIRFGDEAHALVLGSEGEGLRTLTQKKCDELVKLSRRANRDSLNVGVAGAIACYEVTRGS